MAQPTTHTAVDIYISLGEDACLKFPGGELPPAEAVGAVSKRYHTVEKGIYQRARNAHRDSSGAAKFYGRT